MTRRGKITILAIVMAFVTASLIAILRFAIVHPITLHGAVLRRDADPNKESPIADVKVSATSLATTVEGTSDAAGFFSLTFPKRVRRGMPITLNFEHSGYEPLDLRQFVGDQLYVVRMTPIVHVLNQTSHPAIVVGNVRVRYSVKTTTIANIGSAVKTFQIENKGNVPCKGQHPCSPNGKWKAALGAASLDAGEGNEFQNATASCIAGPCPFTKIEDDGFSKGGRHISVTVLNWSDTATFLLQAEVIRPMAADIVREFYPVIFDGGLDFTLPTAAEGVSIEAELGGDAIVFPLGPKLFLSWAQCDARLNSDQTRVYQCELKPGYRFR